MTVALPESILSLFKAAGWPRSAAESRCTAEIADHPAAFVLREFDGLMVGSCDAGEECASSDIVFGRVESLERHAEIRQWQALLATRLICVGEVHHGHGALFMDSSGRCFHSSLVHEAFSFEGENFGVAAERILLGRKGRPMLRPNQRSVTMYGETFSEGHPSIYRRKP